MGGRRGKGGVVKRLAALIFSVAAITVFALVAAASAGAQPPTGACAGYETALSSIAQHAPIGVTPGIAKLEQLLAGCGE
jgi:hypothetical protein